MAESMRKILIGRPFSATADGPQNSIITAITAGGKPALLGAALRVTPGMRFVAQGRNLAPFNRFFILTSGGQTYAVLPQFSRDRQFEYLAFDMPDYGDSAFAFGLRMAGAQPGILAFEVGRSFDYAQETQEKKKDREKKAAEAAAAQAEAEQEQENIKKDEFEKNQTAGLTMAGQAGGAVLDGVAEGLAAAAASVAKAAAPTDHKWQGANRAGQNVPSGSGLRPTDFVNPAADREVGQATGSGEPGAPPLASSGLASSAPAAGSVASSSRRAPPVGAVTPSSGAFRAINEDAEEAEQSTGTIRATAGTAAQGRSAPVGVPTFGSRAATAASQTTSAASVRTTGTVSGGDISSRTSATTTAKSTTSAKVIGTAAVSGSAAAGHAVEASLSAQDNLTVEQRASLHESVGGKQAAAAGVMVEEPFSAPPPGRPSAAGSGEVSVPEPSSKPAQSGARPSSAQPFKNRQALKLEAEYDAKFKAFQKNARDLDVKLKRPEGAVPGVEVSVDGRRSGQPAGAQPAETGGQTATVEAGRGIEGKGYKETEESQPEEVQQTIPDEMEGPDNVPDSKIEVPRPVRLPQSAAAETAAGAPAAGEAAAAGAAEGAAAAEAGGAAMAEGAMMGGPAGIAAAGAAMMASKQGRAKAVKAAAELVAGPEAGLLLSFFKKHWKLILGSLTALLAIVVGIVVVFLLTLTQWMCTHWETYGLIYLSGYKNVCTAIQNVGTGNILPAGAAIGQLNINPGSGQCAPVVSGPASVASLQQTCFGGNAQQASSISEAESGGNPASLSQSDKCADGNPVSVGLFQINLTNHPINGLNCPAAFSSQFTASNKTCIVVNQALYQSCVTAAQNPAYNIEEACVISKNGASWSQWGANSKCGF